MSPVMYRKRKIKMLTSLLLLFCLLPTYFEPTKMIYELALYLKYSLALFILTCRNYD